MAARERRPKHGPARAAASAAAAAGAVPAAAADASVAAAANAGAAAAAADASVMAAAAASASAAAAADVSAVAAADASAAAAAAAGGMAAGTEAAAAAAELLGGADVPLGDDWVSEGESDPWVAGTDPWLVPPVADPLRESGSGGRDQAQHFPKQGQPGPKQSVFSEMHHGFSVPPHPSVHAPPGFPGPHGFPSVYHGWPHPFPFHAGIYPHGPPVPLGCCPPYHGIHPGHPWIGAPMCHPSACGGCCMGNMGVNSGCNGGGATGQPPETSSWSKPTTPSRPESQPRYAAGNQPPSDHGDGEGGESAQSSSAATSEVRSMLRRRMHRESDSRPKSSLGSVKIEEFYGDRSRYLKWKRAIEAQQHLYGLESAELSMLVYLSTRKEARDVVEQHPITAYTGSGGLHLLWKVLDEAFGESETELFERADRELEKCRRQPGESMAHYLAEMRRLRAQYYRIDPETRISDKAWGQKLLQRASLSRRERLDCYYAAGACFESLKIENALRVRCGRIHEDEKRGPTREPRYESTNAKSSSHFKKKVFVKRRINSTHVADQEIEAEGEEEREEGSEEEPEDRQEGEEGAEDEEVEGNSEGEMDEEELKEVFAAGWKAKQKTSEVRKSRGWRPAAKSGGKDQSTDARKRVTTCSSCGLIGHWKGDAECPNVKSGQDPPHKKPNGVHFTFVVGSGSNEVPVPPPGTCPSCSWPVAMTAKFCQQCGHKLLPDQRMAENKRQEPEEDHWDVVEGPSHFTFDLPKDRAKVLAKAKPKQRASSDAVSLGPKELLATLPDMSKEEKRRLKQALELEERQEAWSAMERHRILMEQEVSPYRNEGYQQSTMQGVSSASQDQHPVLPKQLTNLNPPSSKDGKPKAVRDRELQDFRDQLCARQTHNGRLLPSSAAPTPTEEQARCLHTSLKWTANGEGHQARCKHCNLKNVIYYSVRHGVLVVSDSPREINTVHASEFSEGKVPGLAIADSGCRNAVGGEWWHADYQRALTRLQIPFEEVQEQEIYRFGAGDPIVSRKAFIYPVNVHGVPDLIRMSMVGEDAKACPGLIGPSELSRWGAVFRFQEKRMELNGVSRPMRLTATRHPGVDLLDGGNGEVLQKFWSSKEASEKKQRLIDSPASLSFVADATAEEGSESSEAEEEPLVEELSSGEEEMKVEQWRRHLEEDLGVISIPEVDHTVDGLEVGGSESDEGSFSNQETESSSHEAGIEVVSEESEDDEEAAREAEERHAFVTEPKHQKVINKGLRRKLGHHAREIRETAQQDSMAKKEIQKPSSHPPAKKPQSPFCQKRRWSVLEVFTWTCAISLAAVERGWLAHEPITFPQWNLFQDSDYENALSYIDRVQPDLLVLSWPSLVWSPLQEWGRGTPLKRYQLMKARRSQRKLLKFVRDAAISQRRRGGALLGDNPEPSRAWNEPLIIEAFDNTGDVKTDMCCFGLKMPGRDKPLMRKRTRLRGTSRVLKHCAKKCPGTHTHRHVIGGFKISGKWMNVCDFSGGYTQQFAHAVLDGAEAYLEEGPEPEVLVEGRQVEEEQFEDEPRSEEEVHEEEKATATSLKLHRLHQRLGHPTNQTLTRMLALSGASEEMLQQARSLECPTCQEMSAPGRYLKQKAEIRTTIFGKELHCDLKYIHDYKNQLFVALSVVDAATSFHMAVLLRSRAAHHVARKLARHWCSLHGSPELLVIDQGGEFDGEFVGWLEAHGIHSKTTGAKSPWQHGFAERHGALLGTMCSSLIWQYQAQGASQVKDCLAAAVQAKNSTLTKGGYTPYQLAFGRAPLFPDLLEEDVHGNLALRESLSTEGEVLRSAEMRAAARAALLRQDTLDKLKRALKSWPRGEQKEYSPGEMVYFYSPKPKTARFRKDGGSWRGPAVVLMKESHQRYFLSWRGRCLLVSAPNIRSASQREAGNADMKVEEMKEAEDGWQEAKSYEDHSSDPPPPVASQRLVEDAQGNQGGWSPQEGVIRQKAGGWVRSRAAEIAKMLRGTKTVIKKIQKVKRKKEEKDDMKVAQSLKQPAMKISEKSQKSEGPAALGQPKSSTDEVFSHMEKIIGDTSQPDFKARLRQHLQDDVPFSIRQGVKRPCLPMEEEEVRKRFKPAMFHFTLLAASQSGHEHPTRANEWAPRSEVRKMAALMDLPIVGIRYHLKPRKRFQKPPNAKSRGRITVMLNDAVGSAMVCQETAEEVKQHPRRKGAHSWRGMTLFLSSSDPLPQESRVFVELPHGVFEAKVTDLQTWMSLKGAEEDDRRFCEAFLLKNKANGKELDPRFFDHEERQAFKESDKKEWMSWLKNKVVKRLSDEEASKIDKRLIFRAPARMLRVNKGALEGILRAKSRLIIPGHLDPHLGNYRSDSPTTSWVAVQLSKMIAATRGWCATCFDVTTAFLSGKEVSREVYIRPPPEGLPECLEEGESAVGAHELLRVCKSAYGLSEAPRLWYLRATEILTTDVGLEELPMCRATYVLRQEGVVEAIVCLHVDDGFVVASKKTLAMLKKRISEKFCIKEWQDLSEKPVTFLGVKTSYVNGVFYDDMSEYVQKIDAAEVKGPMDGKLEGPELSAFRRLVMQLRWPAHLVMPEFLFATSDLAQRVSHCTFSDLKHANHVLKQMKAAAENGEASLSIRPLKGTPLFVSFFDASLGKSSSAKAQQGEAHFVTTTAAYQHETPANLIEFHSNRVSRVVRSSLAAEGCAMASAGDRMLFNRVLFDALFHGRISISAAWRREMKCEGCLVTDAKGLHDHVHKTGGVATERQSALDILMIKQLVEDEILGLRWTPTWKQLADPLTKEMSGSLLQSFRRKPVLCLIQTPEDEKEEVRRSNLRKAQRERRKARMKTG